MVHRRLNRGGRCLVVRSMTAPQLGRRQLLAASTGTLAVCALCACGGTTTNTSNPPSSPPNGGQRLLPLSELPVGEAKSVTLDGRELIVTRTGDNSAVAFSAICTHQGCTVAPAENELRCPCHGSTYDTRTGHVTGGPAPSPLTKIPVRVDGGTVVTA